MSFPQYLLLCFLHLPGSQPGLEAPNNHKTDCSLRSPPRSRNYCISLLGGLVVIEGTTLLSWCKTLDGSSNSANSLSMSASAILKNQLTRLKQWKSYQDGFCWHRQLGTLFWSAESTVHMNHKAQRAELSTPRIQRCPSCLSTEWKKKLRGRLQSRWECGCTWRSLSDAATLRVKNWENPSSVEHSI